MNAAAQVVYDLFLPTVHLDKQKIFRQTFVDKLATGLTPEVAVQHALVTSCLSLCRYLTIRFTPVRLMYEHDDLFAETLTALWYAATHFDPQVGVKFSTYAGKAVYRRLLHAIEIIRRRGFTETNGKYVNAPVEERNYGGDFGNSCWDQFVAHDNNPDWHASGNAWQESDWERAKASIPLPRWQEIFVLRFRDGLSMNEIAEKLKVSRSRINQIINRIKETLHWKIRKGYLRLPGQDSFMGGLCYA